MVPGQVTIALEDGWTEEELRRALDALGLLPGIDAITTDDEEGLIDVFFDAAGLPEQAPIEAVREAGVKARCIQKDEN